MSKLNSTIFKTITSSVDESRKTLALFNKDWNTYKTNWQNANGIGGKIGSIFASSNASTSASVISNDQVQILRNWNNAVKHGCTDQATFNRIIANADENTKMYFAGLNKGKGSIEGLKNAQKVATQSTIGLTIAQTALNMAITMGITALVSIIAKGYDELANSVENCKERVNNLMSSYKSALDTANTNANRVEELADKYEDLSKGVNNLGENVSLTNEEYQEYNSLVNEIANMFPTLIQGYTGEGNAILNLKGNVEQLRDAYKEAQQEAYNFLIASGEDSDGNDIIKQWEDTHDTGFWSDMLDLGADDVGGGISVSDALEQLRAIQQISADEYREIERITGSGSRKEIAGLTDIEKEIGYGSYLYKALGLNSNSTDEEFREAQRQAKALIQTYNAEIESALSDVETLANAYLMTNEDYDKLDAQSKSAASMIVNNLNADIANGFSSKEDVATYVDGIVQAILSNDKVEGALTDLFTMDTSDMSISEIESQVDFYINTIADTLNEDPVELKTRLGFDNSDTEPLVNKVKGFLSDEFDNKVGELTLDELDIASELQIPEGTLLSWDELIDKIREVQGATASATKFTKSQMIDTINSMVDGFDVLDDIYADVLDGETFDFTKLDTSKFSEAFSEITPEYEKFIETVSSSPTDIKACQGAFNDLVSAFIDSKGILESVDEETKQLTIDMLENMGVVNAEEVVMSALGATFADYATAKRECAIAGVDLVNATNEEIVALINENRVSQATAQGLFLYQAQKALANQNGINTVEDCIQLENLALAAGYTGSALIYLGKIKALLNKIENDKLDEDSLGYKSVMGQVKNYNGLLQQLLSTEVETTKATVNYGGATKTAAAAQDKLKDSTKKATDALEKQKEVLNEQKSELEALHGAIIDYIDDEIDDINDKTDTIDKQNEKLRNQLDIYDDIISAVTNNIDIEIDAIDDKIDKLRDANDEEERAIQLEQARQKLLEARSRKTKLV